MTVAQQIDWLCISGKPVAVIDSHHHALIPWNRWRASAGPLRLISIDHHCDTQESFMQAAFDGIREVDRVRQQALRSVIDLDSEQSIERAVAQLRHDEHIDAAIRAGVIETAFIIHEQNQRTLKSLQWVTYDAKADALGEVEAFLFRRRTRRPDPPMTYAMPADRMVAIDPVYYRKGADLVQPWPNGVIETEHLDDRLRIFEQVLQSAGEVQLESAPYVLDIDMDAFRTLKALQPDDPSTFHRLARGAIGITVARERECCDLLWLDDQVLDTSVTEHLLMRQLDAALS